jgi:hypothetical protein
VDGFEWILEMRDSMTGPAGTARSSLRGLESQMKSTEAEIRKLQATQLMYRQAGFTQGAKEAGNDIAKLRQGLSETRAAHSDLTASAGASAEAMGVLGGAFMAAAAAAAVVAVAFASATYEGGKLALEMSELREHTTAMFTGLSGSAAGGEEMYASIQKLRKILPESEKDLSSWAAKLMGAGMVDPRSVQESIKAMSSASALMGGGEQGKAAADKVSNLIAKSLEGGKFKGMAKTLVGTGVSADDLAKQLGMTPENFQKAFKKGTIEADKGIDALNDVLQRKGAGALAGTMNELPVMMAKAKESFMHLFDGVDVKPFTAAVRQMVGILDTAQPSGRAMKLTITDAFNSIMRIGGETVRALTIGFLYLELGVLKLMHVFAPVILKFREWMHDGTLLTIMYGALILMGIALASIAVTLGLVVAPIVAMGVAFAYAVQKALELKQIVTGVGEAAPNMTKVMGPNATTLGGMGGQLEMGTAPAHATGGRVMQPAPGEVFASVAPGESIAPKGGIAVGAGGGQSAGAAPGSGSRTVMVDVGGIHIEGAGKSAHEIMGMLEDAVADLFDRAALEAGA